MTEFINRTADDYLVDHNSKTCNDKAESELGECVDDSESEGSISKTDSSTSSSGTWSIDDSIEFMQTSHKPLFDELPTFSIRSASPSGRCLSPIVNEPISLFNLSISPISSIEDLTHVSDQSVCAAAAAATVSHTDGKYTKDLKLDDNDTIGSGYDEDERISLEEITAKINTPPSALSRSNKRLNLETIFEDVFFETPKKRRFNGFKRFNSWRIETYEKITNEERINSYVFEQQQNQSDQDTHIDTANFLCNAFDDKINLNT